MKYVIYLGMAIASGITTFVASIDLASDGNFLQENSLYAAIALAVITVVLYGISNRTSRARASICPLSLGMSMYGVFLPTTYKLLEDMILYGQNLAIVIASILTCVGCITIIVLEPRLNRRHRIS